MIKFSKILILTHLCLSASAYAAPPTISTKILEAQLWDGTYFFRIDNPGIVNPANCQRPDWVVSGATKFNGATEAKLARLNEHLIEARRANSTVTLYIGETQCESQNRFLQVRAISF